MSSFSRGDDGPTLAEIVVVVISVALTLSLFGYVGWHAAKTPADVRPEASIVETQTLADGRTVVTVGLYNPSSIGLESVTVSANCIDGSITFQHVPTDARLTGTLVCPPSTADPSVAVRQWVRSQGSRTN